MIRARGASATCGCFRVEGMEDIRPVYESQLAIRYWGCPRVAFCLLRLDHRRCADDYAQSDVFERSRRSSCIGGAVLVHPRPDRTFDAGYGHVWHPVPDRDRTCGRDTPRRHRSGSGSHRGNPDIQLCGELLHDTLDVPCSVRSWVLPCAPLDPAHHLQPQATDSSDSGIQARPRHRASDRDESPLNRAPEMSRGKTTYLSGDAFPPNKQV